MVMAQAFRIDVDWKQRGEQIVACIGARDFERLAGSFHHQVRCRLLLPPGLMTPLGANELARKFRQWFGEADEFKIDSAQIDQVGDCLHVGYRIRLREGGRRYLIEQQTYSQMEDGTITTFDLLCSGFRDDEAAS